MLLATNPWDLDLILIGGEGEPDEFGNWSDGDTETTVMACEEQISRSEFYQAAQSGIRPARLFIIHTFEYDDQQRVKIDGHVYSVVRTFERNSEELELYVERKVGDDDGRSN